jgi:nicotinamidase-related amidase
MSLLDRHRAALLVVDVQDEFRPYRRFAEVATAVGKLVAGARTLGMPIVVSEQYPKGLGHTAAEVDLEDEPRIEKMVFSAARASGFDLGSAEQVLVCGIETHVCVSQTVHDLLADGFEVHVAADAVASRHELDGIRALARMDHAGAAVTTVEAALFELLEGADAPEFKQIQKLIL